MVKVKYLWVPIRTGINAMRTMMNLHGNMLLSSGIFENQFYLYSSAWSRCSIVLYRKTPGAASVFRYRQEMQLPNRFVYSLDLSHLVNFMD